MYLLCAYKIVIFKIPVVYILGVYDTLERASNEQEKLCGKIKKINHCWHGRNNVISWIKILIWEH